MTRRGFGLGLGAALLLLGVPIAWSSVDEERFLVAATEAIFPPTGSLPSPAEVGVAANVRAYLDALPPSVAWQARGLFRLVEGSTLVTHGATFSSLDVPTRTAVLEAMATSSLYPRRLMATSLKQMCAMGYWQSPKTWAYLGYDGPLVGERR